jgi:hypothetical protein
MVIFECDRIRTAGDVSTVTLVPLDTFAVETGSFTKLEIECSREGVKKFTPGFLYDIGITGAEYAES